MTTSARQNSVFQFLAKLSRWGLVFLALLVILEIGFRVYFKDHYSGHGPCSRKIWVEKYGNHNSLGYRDHEFTRTKPPGTFRILAVGDAFTYGEGVESVDDLFTEILERMLNAPSDLASTGNSLNFEVVNVSQRVWEVDDYLSAISDPGLSFSPDVIIVGLYINDIEDRSYPRPEKRTLPQKLVRLNWRLRRLLEHHVFLYWYTVTPYAQRKYKEFWLDFVSGYVDPESHHWTRFVGIYEKIFQLGREQRIPVVVAVFPYLIEMHDGHRYISTYERLAVLARENGATAVNFFPVFKQYDSSDLRAGLTRRLPSEEAHVIIAEELYDHLRAHELVPR